MIGSSVSGAIKLGLGRVGATSVDRRDLAPVSLFQRTAGCRMHGDEVIITPAGDEVHRHGLWPPTWPVYNLKGCSVNLTPAQVLV